MITQLSAVVVCGNRRLLVCARRRADGRNHRVQVEEGRGRKVYLIDGLKAKFSSGLLQRAANRFLGDDELRST